MIGCLFEMSCMVCIKILCMRQEKAPDWELCVLLDFTEMLGVVPFYITHHISNKSLEGCFTPKCFLCLIFIKKRNESFVIFKLDSFHYLETVVIIE